MYEWKNNCINSEKKLKGKIEQFVANVKIMKKKIKDERNQTVPSAINL